MDNNTVGLIVVGVAFVGILVLLVCICKMCRETKESEAHVELATPAPPSRDFHAVTMNMNVNMNQHRNIRNVNRSGPAANPLPSFRPNRSNANSNVSQETRAASNDPGCFSDLVPYRLDDSKVMLTRKLSTSAFGVVWLGHFEGTPVAIKRLLHSSSEDLLSFSREIRTMATLSHPKIVGFVGCTWTNASDLSGITEYMAGGDLRSLLENRKLDLSWRKEKIAIAIDIVEALVFMHSLNPRMIHRDLKSRNVLLNAAMVAKLSGFGLSRNRTYEETLTAGVGNVRWTAPEIMLRENYSEKADVYSFGVVLSELDTREIPFEEKPKPTGAGRAGVPTEPDMALVIKVAKGELRPTFSPDCPKVIDHIAKACLQFSPALRPTSQQVLRMLRDAKMDLQRSLV